MHFESDSLLRLKLGVKCIDDHLTQYQKLVLVGVKWGLFSNCRGLSRINLFCPILVSNSNFKHSRILELHGSGAPRLESTCTTFDLPNLLGNSRFSYRTMPERQISGGAWRASFGSSCWSMLADLRRLSKNLVGCDLEGWFHSYAARSYQNFCWLRQNAFVLSRSFCSQWKQGLKTIYCLTRHCFSAKRVKCLFG